MSAKHLTTGEPDGSYVGQSTSDKIGFYGVTPVVQQSGSAQAAISPTTVTDASGGTGAATNGILTLTGSYNSTILANAIATLAARTNANTALLLAIRTALVNQGLIAGS